MNVSVCVRIRSPSTAVVHNDTECISTSSSSSSSSSNTISISNPSSSSSNATLPSLSFQFDNIFSSNTQQKELFDTVAYPLVRDLFNGVNCTLFTYGQTGSGKTWTMQGNMSANASNDKGIVPRTAEAIFDEVARNTHMTDYDIKLSVMEIYKERLIDLLSISSSSSSTGSNNSLLRIREQQNQNSSFGTGVWVEGLTESCIKSYQEFNDSISIALKRRTTGSHLMNKESSRSHLVVIISMKQTSKSSSNCSKVYSKLHLVDLAGSEMVRKTDASGSRLDEAKHINKSLSALGKVIFALTSSPSSSCSNTVNPSVGIAKHHIPYRDSKLTRLLQDSLGGNAKTVLILTASSSLLHMQETVATLRFGERARQLKNKPHVNKEVDENTSLKLALARANQQIIAINATASELQTQLEILQQQLNSTNGHTASFKCELCSVVTSPTKEIKTNTPIKLSNYSTNINNSSSSNGSSDSNQEEGDDDEVPSRCAICGLNDVGTEVLQQETGEWLGSLFTCDGNCGCSFHTRCVGIVDDIGPPDDQEWYA